MSPSSELPLVSVLFVTYKRVDLLRKTLEGFLEHTSYPALELVVTDDGSGPEIQDEIRSLPFHKFVLSPKNRGLGANNNAGLGECSGQYVLMIQDDRLCQGPREYLKQAVGVLQANPRVGLIKFQGEEHVLDLDHRLKGADEPCYPIPTRLSGVVQPLIYSDTPHIMPRVALDRIGSYKENCRMEESELDYVERFAAQEEYVAALFPRYYNSTFINIGIERSLRTALFRNRLEKTLLPIARRIERCCPPAFRVSKLLFRKSVRLLEKAKVLR